MNQKFFLILLTASTFGLSIAASADECGKLPYGPPPPHSGGSIRYGSPGSHYPPGVVPCPPVPPRDIVPGYGAIFFPGWYYNYYTPYYYPQDDKIPIYYQNVKTAGEIRVLVRTPDAKVYIDGVEVTDLDSENAYITGVLTGMHTVEVRAEGYEPYSEKVTVETAQTTSRTVELRRE